MRKFLQYQKFPKNQNRIYIYIYDTSCRFIQALEAVECALFNGLGAIHNRAINPPLNNWDLTLMIY